MIEEYDLGKTVTLDGPARDVKELYSNTSILALSSRYEGLPMVLLESQAAGIPAVSFACKCGPRDIIEDGRNGLLVPEGDTGGFADALLRLMTDDALRKAMGAEAYQMSDAWSEAKIMHRWKALFGNL